MDNKKSNRGGARAGSGRKREPLHKDAKGNRGLYKAEVQGGKCSYRLLDNHQARTLTKIAPPTRTMELFLCY